ncbi:MAG: hypothetical protein HRU09_03085 [Oligoflexales bacterium]|nr:hypothetical protein [Oligoflexales bacterium]
MTTTFLILLTLFDVGILIFLFILLQKKQGNEELLQDLTEERRLLNNLKNEIKSDIDRSSELTQSQVKKMMKLAAEVERDANLSKENLASHLEEVFTEFTQKLESPMLEMTKKHHLLESMLRKVEFEKKRLLKAIQKGEKICKFFHNDLPYDELLKDIELKKYEDARKLLTQGYSSEKVATELGMRVSEVELLESMAIGS